MNKRLLIAIIITSTSIMPMVGAREYRNDNKKDEYENKANIIKIDAKEGFLFWGKPAIVTGVYEEGDIQQTAKKGRTAVEFLFDHPEKGKLLYIEIQNPQEKPTVIEPQHGGLEYKVKFDDKGNRWYVKEVEIEADEAVTPGHIEGREGSNSVTIENETGFFVGGWGGENAIATGIYEEGEIEKAIPGRQEISFMIKHPRRGMLQQIEIQNPYKTEPTIVDPAPGMEYEIKFDKEAQIWKVTKVETE